MTPDEMTAEQRIRHTLMADFLVSRDGRIASTALFMASMNVRLPKPLPERGAR